MTTYTTSQKVQETADERAQREKDALFAAWSDDRQAPSPQPLRAWLNRYPQYADALIGWAADIPVLECGLENARPDPVGEAQTLTIGRQVLAEMRAKYFASAEMTQTAATPQHTTVPIADLVQAAKVRGLTAKTLAGQIGIGLPLVAKLNQRLIRLATLPDELINRLAEALQTSGEQVRAYLTRPATLSGAAQYKSDSIPSVSEPQDFAEAVRTCVDMTEDQKQFWLNQ
jgi:hypothetical protein